ncbi:hypothetical protein FACS1894124_1680 [Spirochaetia bacterium]|nr:hypothetical protein FACS1894124_1680 [Spirochaetia bacterium]
MRTIAVIGVFVISTGFFFAGTPAYSQTFTLKNTAFTLSTEAKFGAMYGEGEEIVYGAPSGAEYLSQLLWDMKPLWYAGTGLSLRLTNPAWRVGLFTGLSVKLGIPGRTGSIIDRDWKDYDNQYLTNFSIHDNDTQKAIFIDYDIGLSIPIRFNRAYTMNLNLFERLSWMELAWYSRDGYKQYGTLISSYPERWTPWDPSIPKTPLSGPAISYSQVWLIVALGLALDFPVLDWFSIGVSCTASPLIYAAAEDHHMSPTNKVQFNDYPQGGLLLEPHLEFVFSPREWLDLSLHASYRHISGAKGDSYKNNSPVKSGDSIGAGYHALDAGLSFQINFQRRKQL